MVIVQRFFVLPILKRLIFEKVFNAVFHYFKLYDLIVWTDFGSFLVGSHVLIIMSSCLPKETTLGWISIKTKM